MRSDTCNNHDITITEPNTFAADDETTWSLPGVVVGFVVRLLVLGFPCLMYGPDTLFFFLYIWPLFLALLPVAIVVGIALHSLLEGRLLLSITYALFVVGAMLSALFLWLLGQIYVLSRDRRCCPLFDHNSDRNQQ